MLRIHLNIIKRSAYCNKSILVRLSMWVYDVDQLLARRGHVYTYMALRTYIWNEHEVEIVVTDSVNVLFFCLHTCYDMIWCVVPLWWWMLPIKNEDLKARLVIPGTWCRVWFMVRVCDTWCIIRKWWYSYERFFWTSMWYLVPGA